jgi:hypothetical protein
MIMLVGGGYDDSRVPVAQYRGNNALLSNHSQYQKQLSATTDSIIKTETLFAVLKYKLNNKFTHKLSTDLATLTRSKSFHFILFEVSDAVIRKTSRDFKVSLG